MARKSWNANWFLRDFAEEKKHYRRFYERDKSRARQQLSWETDFEKILTLCDAEKSIFVFIADSEKKSQVHVEQMSRNRKLLRKAEECYFE